MPKERTLYLVRHAPAAPRGDKWPDDDVRPLTHEGIARMRQIVRGLRTLDVRVDLVLSSPLVRAAATAELLVDGMTPTPDLITVPALAPGSAPDRVVEALASHSRRSAIALVGHEPDLGRLGAWLVGANTPFVFKKGGVCRIDLVDWPPARNGQLVWQATPRMLRALA
jgi:phosphohistidine phosphatase